MAWQGIEGHDAVAEQFVRAAAHGRLAGAYLFVGPAGVGKAAFARALAKALLCERPQPGLVACGGCGSCVQAAAGTHPDIDLVEKPADRATIPLEAFIGDAEHRMREGLCWRILLRPALGRRRVAIVLDADHLSEEAANCLLKTLEEPPDTAVIILVGTALERQLPTIRSRCRIMRFRPLPTPTLLEILWREQAASGERVADDLLAAAAAAAGGSLVRARELLDPELAAFRGRLAAILARRPLAGVELARETITLVEAAGKDAAPRRARLRAVLGMAIELLRAALRTTGPGRAGAAAAFDIDAAVVALGQTLDALEAVDRNANLTTLVDAWTAVVEEPRIAAGA